jgi:hypothetical protein
MKKYTVVSITKTAEFLEIETTDINEAIATAKYYDDRITREERRKGNSIEIRIYANEYDYDTIEF